MNNYYLSIFFIDGVMQGFVLTDLSKKIEYYGCKRIRDIHSPLKEQTIPNTSVPISKKNFSKFLDLNYVDIKKDQKKWEHRYPELLI